MGQVPPKSFLPSAPYGASEATNALNPSQPAAQNPQTPLLPPNFSDPGTMNSPQAVTGSVAGANPFKSRQQGMGGSMFGRGLFGLLLLFLAPSLWATTTVTGSIKNLGTAAVTPGSFVRFWLRGCAGNQPTVSGTAVIAPTQGGVFFFDIAADSGGNVSGTIYSTRDAAGTGNGDISCGGSATAVWYGMQIWAAGKAGPEVAIHAKNTATLDITQVTPITTNPVITSPTGDTTYLRLDAGNSPVTGNVNFTGAPGVNATNVGTFTNTQMFSYNRAIINGCSPTNIVATPGSLFTNDAVMGCNNVPASATITGANGIAGYTSNASTTTNAVGGYFVAKAAANSSHNWGINPVCSDQFLGVTYTSVVCLNEIDQGITSTTTTGNGLILTGAATVSNHNFSAIQVQPGIGAFTPWWIGLQCNSGATGSGVCLNILQAATGANQFSQQINFASTNAGSVAQAANLVLDPNGNLDIRPGAFTFAFNSNGLFTLPGSGGAVQSGSANASGTGIVRLANVDKIVWRNSGNTADHAMGEYQTTRGTAGCTTAASIAATCTTVITWPSVFADTSYTVSCIGGATFTGTPILQGVTNKVAASVTIQTMALTAAASQFATIDCSAIHD